MMINFRDHERMPHGLEKEKVEKHPTQEVRNDKFHSFLNALRLLRDMENI